MLARYGWAASLTRDGLERTDVLAVHSETREMVEVQVKIVRSGSWMLGRKGTLPDRSGREWYVFVLLGAPPGLPESYVVPRDHVAAATWIGHQAWLTDPDVPTGKRNAPIEMARLGPEAWVRDRDAWDQLGGDARRTTVRLPVWMRSAMDLDRVGLPADHPWRDSRSIPEWIE
ncbi:MAG TPA: hypothetical protein VF533_25700 [Solirubrobacteraceae bacterium]|jgi:hypothetical protein